MQEVTLIQMLEARERRVWEQQRLILEYGTPLVCFTMNIPGPVKDTPLIRRSFDYGWSALEYRIPKGKLCYRSVTYDVTGCQALYAVDLDPVELKRICVVIEDSIPMGRLYDMDVLDGNGKKLDRETVNGGSRDCIVCGAPGRGCASRRIHSVAELQEASNALIRNHFRRQDAESIGTLAARALLDEVCTTPKPGLVDRRNTGSHRDMDMYSFISSTLALTPYFMNCVRIGQDTAQLSPGETFEKLRQRGLMAEQEMLAATGGVNTHKGAIFSVGILCGAAGRLWKPDAGWEEQALFEQAAFMTSEAMDKDLQNRHWNTAGERLYAARGVKGVRGEIVQGMPSVTKLGLPVFRRELAKDGDRNRAGMVTLLHLICQVEDTNMLHRGGPEKTAQAVEKVKQILQQPTVEAVESLDDWFIRENLSPGGCADLLAVIYFVEGLRKRNEAAAEAKASTESSPSVS